MRKWAACSEEGGRSAVRTSFSRGEVSDTLTVSIVGSIVGGKWGKTRRAVRGSERSQLSSLCAREDPVMCLKPEVGKQFLWSEPFSLILRVFWLLGFSYQYSLLQIWTTLLHLFSSLPTCPPQHSLPIDFFSWGDVWVSLPSWHWKDWSH